jgi:L-2-hydroxyglutarate oxidase LhgO
VKTVDVLVVGGGVVGLAIAREWRRRDPKARIAVLEKESKVGEHASGRNSGVLHAGFYYSADSMKAKLCRLGNAELRRYCEEKKLPINRAGKLVVARSADEIPTLDELLRRARLNGVELEKITAADAKKIEPRVKTFEWALWSPTTSTVNPSMVVESLAEDLRQAGVEILTETQWTGRTKDIIHTNRGDIQAGYIVNAAGVYADTIARSYGFSEHHRMLPFKGIYLYSNEPVGALRTNIYPVPNIKNPFLGVHFTITVDGHAKIGPTAIPALWLEQYDWLGRFRPWEAFTVMMRELGLLAFSDFDFKTLAWQEIKKYSRRRLVSESTEMLEGVSLDQYKKWGRPGIRAQLMDMRTKKLEMDFRMEGDHASFHVLNAVSPAFTCSLPFAAVIVDEIEKLRR